jgi:signal transduction histidine kinase
MGDAPGADPERRIRILTRLTEISTVLNSSMKLKAVLNTLMDAAAEIADSEAASVLLWDANANELRFAATSTDDGEGSQLIGKVVPLDGSIAGKVLRENRIITVDNTQETQEHYDKVDKAIAFQTVSLIGVPMRAKNRVIGVLEAVNKRSLPWSDDDAQYLSVLAAQAAVAIENAQLVAALQKANDELSQVDKLKSDFIAIASHELRTPLGVILGYASFLQETNDPQVNELASKVVNSATQLRRIIEDLTNLQYLEQGAAELKRENVPLEEFLKVNLGEIRGLAEARGHRLMVKAPNNRVTLKIDRIRMNMALTNLLNNAVRFTPEKGEIRVEVELRGSEVWIMVKDNGIGLSPGDTERIFERFVQVEDHMTRQNGGLGIGLSISRALVQAHGGRLWAVSPGLNQGSTFIISLPL